MTARMPPTSAMSRSQVKVIKAGGPIDLRTHECVRPRQPIVATATNRGGETPLRGRMRHPAPQRASALACQPDVHALPLR